MFKSKNKFYLVGTVLLWLVMIVGTIVSTRIVQQSADNRGKATDSIHDYSDCRRLPSGSYFCGGTRGGTPCEPDLTKGGDYCIENGVSVPCSSIGRIRCQCNNGVWVIGSEGQDCSGLCGATNNVCDNGSCNNPTETPPPPTSPPTVKPPTATPTKKPSATPTKKPSATPTKKPSATPTIKPTVTPTKVPTATPTIKLSPTPTDVITPTFEPTNTVTPNPTATNTPEPTATPTNQPTATPTNQPTSTPTTKPQTCGYSPCNSANLICSNGLVCIQASDNNNYCSKPELTNNCSVNPGYDGCCLGITNTPAPTRVIAEGPTPTVIILPEAGFEFPGTATVILGMITALVGLFIIL